MAGRPGHGTGVDDASTSGSTSATSSSSSSPASPPSPTLYEAAIIDGANKNQTFWRITLPLLKPTVVLVSVMAMLQCLKTFSTQYRSIPTERPGSHQRHHVQHLHHRYPATVPRSCQCDERGALHHDDAVDPLAVPDDQERKRGLLGEGRCRYNATIFYRRSSPISYCSSCSSSPSCRSSS